MGYRMGLEDGSVRASKFWDEAGYFSKPRSSADLGRLKKLVRWDIETSALVDGMTAVYRDPANVNVRFKDALLITVARLQGGNVEELLGEARRVGREIHQKSKSKE